MNAICNHSSAVPEWVTISEAANIINQQPGISVTEAAIWRYALYGHLILSVYFQSPVKMRRIKTIKSNIVLTKVKDDIVGRLCNLSPECLTTDDYWRVKTEGEIISPASYIIDTPLMGHECIALQQRLAFSLSLPPPQTGHCNIHCGITVQRGGSLYQIVENISSVQRITQQLQCLSPGKQEYYREKLNRLHINREQHNYFPVYHFPDDAWFVIKRVHLEQFICIFLHRQKIKKNKFVYPPLYPACCGWPANITTVSAL
ncbi:hypothetical protein OM219_20530 [Escherichia albertii]|nr:hypothetical protein [Escherichia albertii]